MSRKPVDNATLDTLAYRSADEVFRLATQHLPEGLVHDLAREVVRRLAFRMPGVGLPSGFPTDQDIDRFCAALLSTDEQAADRIILNVRRDGAGIETIYLGYIAGASSRLGEMWETDQVSFVDVSVGTGRLYRILRGLRHAVAPVLLQGRTRSPALFALVPGETHALGIEIAADLFRRDGGEVDVCVDLSHDEILNLAETRHHGVIVLVANSNRVVPALVQLAVALRISQPVTPLALAGSEVDLTDVDKGMIAADLEIADIPSAIPELRRLTEDV